MKQAILYSRYSSDQQAKGDTLRRQIENGRAYAKKLGFDLVEVTESGVSAYKPKNNANSGKLADLIEQAEKGIIPRGTVLIVESLDRVTRQSPIRALSKFIQILEAGLEIHTIGDGTQA